LLVGDAGRGVRAGQRGQGGDREEALERHGRRFPEMRCV
jgi:hypothetical protein